MQTSQVAQEVPKEFKVLQSSFEGGFRRVPDFTKLQENEFGLLINGRCRDGVIQPIKKHLDISSGIPTKYRVQGIYGYDDVLVVFANGLAWTKNLTLASNYFHKMAGFGQMDIEVEYIFAEAVPGSYKNRRVVTSDIDGSSKIVLMDGSPFGIVVQDGKTRPQLIDPYGGAGFLQDYNQWNLDKREYVPIGKNMVYHNGILFLIAPNGKEIYRSVTGRPLDFMVIITSPEGDKYSTEDAGGAHNVSHKVDFEALVDIRRIVSRHDSFLATTGKTSYLVQPNYDSLIFAEPTFNNIFLFSTGPVDNFSVTDVRGDTKMIDPTDIVSFNDAVTDGNEGRNDPFAKNVALLFDSVDQSYTAAITFNNYGLFAVNTIFGPGILVYDNKLERWASLDLLEPEMGFIKQFAISVVNRRKKLFFFTSTNRVYEAYGSSEIASCKLYTREWTTLDPQVETQPQIVNLIFTDVKEPGEISVTPYVDRQEQRKLTKAITGSFDIQSYPMITPFGNATKDSCRNIIFSWAEGLRTGWKTGLFIEWNFQATLAHIMLLGSPKTSTVPFEQSSYSYA